MKKYPKCVDFRGFLTFQILHELKKKKLCGDELAENIGKKKGFKLTPGTIYPALKKLRRNKLVVYKRYGRKKIYFLTNKGRAEYNLSRKLFREIFSNVLK